MLDFLENYDKIKQGNVTPDEAKRYKQTELDIVNIFKKSLNKGKVE